MMKRKYSIKKNSEIDAIFKSKKSRGNAYFVIYSQTNQHNEHFRFALSIGRKYGNAVSRNKIKRQIRAIIYQFQVEIDRQVDFVVVIKPSAKGLSFDQITAHIADLLKYYRKNGD